MKIQINENNRSFYVSLEPETTDEAAQLMRLAASSKRKPIDFTTYFGSKIYCKFGISKKDSSHCTNFITNRAKK